MLDTLTLLRTFCRKIGLVSFLTKITDFFEMLFGQSSYEKKFDLAMLEHINVGDVIWDVGANVGYYTLKFANAVGKEGLVYAFEPAPNCFRELQNQCAHLKNIHFFNYGLGEHEAKLLLHMANNPLDSTHSFVSNDALSDLTIETKIMNGDFLIEKEQVACPNIIKIDVEGYEEEVLLGLRKTLSLPACKKVFCEIHFSLLEKKKQQFAPARIIKLLKEVGFKVKWIDRSHIAAVKRN